MEKLADHFKDLLEASWPSWLPPPDCQFITRTSRNVSGLHETEAAPRAEDACWAASKLAQERCLPEHWASNNSCDCIDTLTPIGMLHSEIYFGCI